MGIRSTSRVVKLISQEQTDTAELRMQLGQIIREVSSSNYPKPFLSQKHSCPTNIPHQGKNICASRRKNIQIDKLITIIFISQKRQ